MQMHATSDHSVADSATVRLYLEMRKRVLDGRLRGGQLIQTSSVLSYFECGMTAAREAMRRLRAEGYFRQDPRGRNFVRGWAHNDIVDAWTLGSTIWGYSALRFAERCDVFYKTRLNALMSLAQDEVRLASPDNQFVLSCVLVTLRAIAMKSHVYDTEATLDHQVPAGLRRISLQALTIPDMQRLCSQLQNAINFALTGQSQLASQGVEMAVRSILPSTCNHFSWLASMPATVEAVFVNDGDVQAPVSPNSDILPYYGIGSPEITDIDKWIAEQVGSATADDSEAAFYA